MKWSKIKRFRVVLIGFVTAFVLGGESTQAEFNWDTATNLGSIVNSSSHDFSPWISDDDLSLYFASTRPGGSGNFDLWVATRESIADDWQTPVNLGTTINSSVEEWFPCISADGLNLYFARGLSNADIWVTTRSSTQDTWGIPIKLASPVNSSTADAWPNISPDGCTLYFGSNRSGGYGDYDIWVVTRETTQNEWGDLRNLGPNINTPDKEAGPCISADGLSLVFHTRRPDGYGSSDLYISQRDTIDDEWSIPINLGSSVNSSYYDLCPSMSTSGISLYFSDYLSNPRPDGLGSADLWYVSISPIIDFNSDGIVDSVDICRMVDCWGTDEPLYDIAPPPFGDSIVDIEDLKVLAEYLFEEVNDPTLITHWSLDEAHGATSYDNIADCDGTLIGDPVWQPDGGVVGGAIELDGINDYISTDFVLNPVDGPFSVFVWIKGGAPGQVIISQSNGANWLMADSDFGCLMTELMPPAVGRFRPQPLKSESVITDDQWHRIGFVWDGENRSLYVDDILVAEDTQNNLSNSLGGLNIGCGSNSVAGTFFSGLIDDIHIYNRAVHP